MALILDAGSMFAQADRNDPHHASVVEVLRRERQPLVTSELACAEADYLILSRLGPDSELAFLRDLAEGTFIVECLTRTELGVALDLSQKYRDLELGLADLSLVILARKHKSRRILTFDERGFRAVEPLQGGAFTLLPADA